MAQTMGDPGAGMNGLQHVSFKSDQSQWQTNRGPNVDPYGIIMSPKKKRMKQTPLRAAEKQTVINIYKQVKESWPADTPCYKTELIKKTAEVAGVSRATVYKIFKEYNTKGRLQSPPRQRKRMKHNILLEHDMENYIQYKIMGSVKRIRLKPHCIPSRFGLNRKPKSASNESHLAEAKRLRISISEDSVQDYLKEDNVKASSSCIEDSQTALAVPSIENKYDIAVPVNQVQENIATQVVVSQKHKTIQACPKAQYRRKQVQTGVKNKDEEITSPIKFFVSSAISPLKTSVKNATKPSTSQSTVSRELCFIEENCDSDTSSAPTLVGSTVDQNYSPSKASLSKTTSDTSLLAEHKKLEKEDSLQSENEIKVFCPKCNTEVSHTTEGIQKDQTKILIAKVYHYFEREYEELKTIYGDLDLTPLSKFRQRTALATGVSETTVLQILKEEEGRNADKRHEPPVRRRRARKRSKRMDTSSEEDSSDDNDNVNEQSSIEVQTLVVKVEPPEYYNAEPEIYFPATVKVEPSDIELNTEQAQTDPICVNVKIEPRSDVVDNTNEMRALNEPTGTKRKARKIPRSDVTPTRQHTQGESSTSAAASSVRLKVKEELDESSLFGDTEIKVEEIEIHEEGVG